MSAILLASFALIYSSMAALCVTTERQYAELRGRGLAPPPSFRRRLRLFAAGGLLLSLYGCVLLDGWAVGLVCWTGALTAASVLLVLLWSYAPRAAARLAVCTTILAAITGLTGLGAML